MQALHREADQLAAQERTLLGDLRKLELERQIKIEELRQLDADAAQVEARAARTITEQLTQLQAEVDADASGSRSPARRDVQARTGAIRAAAALHLRRPPPRAGGAHGRRAREARSRSRRGASDGRSRSSHRRARRSTSAAAASQTLRAEARRAEAEVARAARARSDAIREIDRQRDLNAQLAGELQAAQQKLQAALRTLSTGAPVAEPREPAPQDVPRRPRLADRGNRSAPIRRVRPPAARLASNGIEIAAPEGAPVTAVHEGVVAFADAFSGFGNLVIVDHGAQSFSLYGNLLDIGVKKGAIVEAGQPLGTVGATLTGTGRALLRIARRRSAGRSLTMVEARSIVRFRWNLGTRSYELSYARLIVMSISAPVIAFAIVGGLLGKVMAREETFQHLKPFDDVVELHHQQLRGRGQGREGDAGRDARPGRRPRSRQRVSHRRPGERGREPARRCRQAISASSSRASTTCASSRRATVRPRRRPVSAAATTCAPSTTSRRARCRSGKACGRFAAHRARR